jgi:hypothetical protein
MLCFNGACEETALEIECGNVHGAMSAYVSGWTFTVGDMSSEEDLKADEPVKIYYKGKEYLADFSQFSCKPIDDGSCPFFGETADGDGALDLSGIPIPFSPVRPAGLVFAGEFDGEKAVLGWYASNTNCTATSDEPDTDYSQKQCQ